MPFSLLSADGQSKYDVRDGAPMLVGRAPTCDVPVFDPTVSRRHAELSLVAGGVKVTDLGSANGTFVNGEKITDRTVRNGDVVTFGKVVFKLQDSAPPRAMPPGIAGAPAGATIVRSIKGGSTSFGMPSVADLEAQGGRVVCTREPQVIADSVFVSGEIPRRTSFETGLPGQHRRTEDGNDWEPDELLIDERFVAVNVRGKGLVVLTACSHAGVVNVLNHARESFPGVKLHCVLGGLHLSGLNERVIPQTVEALKGFDLDVVAAGHCTGWRAMAALTNAFGDKKLAPLAVGKRLSF